VWTIDGLGADGPDPERREKVMLFGQFVGDWDILQDRILGADGTWITQRGELHWRWILGGRAVQDVWMMFDERKGRAIPIGTTVRLYDPKIDAWHSIWISSEQQSVRAFVARQIGEEIVLDGRSPEGHAVKWVFSEITPNSFRWRWEETRDDGKTWELREEMRIRRRETPDR
jgi:hypothetical protein